jgi:Tol biopolymer transport system component
MAQPFEPAGLKLVGQPVPVAEQVGDLPGSHNYSASLNGILAYRAGGAIAGRELVWIDRTGKRLSVLSQSGGSLFETLSPDGKTVALVLTRQRGISSDIWLYDVGRASMSRFTFGPGLTVSPIWSPDGSQIAYGANHGAELGEFSIYQRPVRTAGQEPLLLRAGSRLRLNDWSRDGKTIVYVPDTRQPDLWLLPMYGDHKPTPYLQSRFGEYNAQFSPDGRWMAYTSDESGREEVYVQPVPATGAKWPISTAGGSRARWRRDGKELFYIAADQRLMSVPVKSSATFEVGIPQPLFQTSILSVIQPYQFFYTPSPDGQKFLMNVPGGGAAQSPITVVLNWQAGLKK